jgi:polysaccharide export outer membrane protein
MPVSRTWRHLLSVPLFLVASVLAACSGPGSGLPPVPHSDVTQYQLGPGDQVRIITFSDEQLTGDFRVDASGHIALPLLGTVKASGLTTSQLENEVAQELQARNLYRNPSVAVEVISYRPIFILGEVNRPGEYPYQPGMTVVSAVAIAGGFTYRAIEDEASVVRNVNGRPVEGRAVRTTPLRPGDVVTIYQRMF